MKLNFEKPLKDVKHRVFHIADMQYEVNTKQQRFDEYSYMNDKVIDSAKNEKPNIIIIAGDVYQNGNRKGDKMNVNSTEEQLFTNLLRGLLNVTDAQIVVFPGNHDVEPSNANKMVVGDEVKCFVDNLEVVIDALDSDRISYLKYTGLHTLDIVNLDGDSQPCNFILHSQYNKHHKFLGEYVYTGLIPENQFVIDLWHDPTKGCSIGFDGKEQKTSHTPKGTDIFRGNSIFAGDIHSPSIHEIRDDIYFAYCSSTCMRGFGEGDYYNNYQMIQNGSKKHGYMVWELDYLGYAQSIDFKPIEPNVNRITIHCDQVLKYVPTDKPSHVKVKVNGLSPEEVLETKKNLSDQNNILSIKFNTEYKFESGDSNQTLEDVVSIDKDVLHKLSLDYIEEVVSKSKGIDREFASRELKALINKSLENFLISNKKSIIKINHIDLKNFKGVYDIEVRPKALTRVKGTNGGGKTTIAKALRWCVSGMETENEKKNQKNKNLLLLKNKLNDDNKLSVTVYFEHNGDSVKVVRGVVYEKKPNMTLSVEVNGQELIGDKQAYLDSVFTPEVLNSLYYNQTSLETLVKSDSKSLRSSILTLIGINAVEALSERYNELKEEYLSNYHKPRHKGAFYETQIGKFTDSQNEAIEECKVLSDDKGKFEDEIAILISDNEDDYDYLDSITTNVQLEGGIRKKIEGNENMLNILKEDLSNKESEIKRLSGESEMVDVSLLEKDLSRLESELEAFKSELDHTETSLKENEINLLKIKEVGVKIKDEITLKVKESEQDKVKSLEEINRSINDENKNNDFELSKLESELENKILVAKSKQTEYKSKLNEMKVYNNQTCANCGQPHSINMEELKNQSILIKRLETEFKSLKDEVDEFKQSFENRKKEIDEIKRENRYKLINNNSLIGEIQANISKKIESEVKKDPRRNEMAIEYKRLYTLNDELLIKRDNLKDDITNHNMTISSTKKDIFLANKENSQILARGSRIDVLTNEIHSVKISIVETERKIESDKKEVEEFNFQERHKSVTDAIKNRNDLINQKQLNLAETKNELNQLYNKIDNFEREIELCKTALNDIQSYSSATKVLNLFKKIVTADGLPKYIFNCVSNIINTELNNMYEKFPFTVEFVDGDLTKIDKRHGNKVEIPASGFSNMESTLSALGLIYVLRKLNKDVSINYLFLDELSGALSDGTDLKERKELGNETNDYKKMYCDMLKHISKNLNVIFVDHDIKINGTNEIEIATSQNGSVNF